MGLLSPIITSPSHPVYLLPYMCISSMFYSSFISHIRLISRTVRSLSRLFFLQIYAYLSSLLTSHCCSSSGFPCVWLRLVYWSLRSTATFVICVHWSLLFAFSLHFLPPLPFSYISSHSPPILALVFLVFWNLLASLSRIFSVIYHLSF